MQQDWTCILFCVGRRLHAELVYCIRANWCFLRCISIRESYTDVLCGYCTLMYVAQHFMINVIQVQWQPKMQRGSFLFYILGWSRLLQTLLACMRRHQNFAADGCFLLLLALSRYKHRHLPYMGASYMATMQRTKLCSPPLLDRYTQACMLVATIHRP